jgi:hypothetical protein
LLDAQCAASADALYDRNREDPGVTDTETHTAEDRRRLYGALRSELNNLSVQDIRNTAAAAGFDVVQLPAQSEARTGLGSRAEVMPALDRLFGEMSPQAQEAALRMLAEGLIAHGGSPAAGMREILGRHGYLFIEGSFVPIGLLDARERPFLPPTSASELARATARLVDGDYTGAITAACGAIDLATQDIYAQEGLGDPAKVAFAAKICTALKQRGVFEGLERGYAAAGMANPDALAVSENLRKATNHAAEALQTIRSKMGDAHGAKPTARKTAYDAIKWASAICGLLADEEV